MKIDIGRNKKQARMERKKQKERILKSHMEKKTEKKKTNSSKTLERTVVRNKLKLNVNTDHFVKVTLQLLHACNFKNKF